MEIKKYRGFNKFSTKEPRPDDVWLVKFPYTQLGNWYKIRPALVVSVDEDIIRVRKITTKKDERFNYPITIENNNNIKQSYLSIEDAVVNRYMLIRKVGSYHEKKGEL